MLARVRPRFVHALSFSGSCFHNGKRSLASCLLIVHVIGITLMLSLLSYPTLSAMLTMNEKLHKLSDDA